MDLTANKKILSIFIFVIFSVFLLRFPLLLYDFRIILNKEDWQAYYNRGQIKRDVKHQHKNALSDFEISIEIIESKNVRNAEQTLFLSESYHTRGQQYEILARTKVQEGLYDDALLLYELAIQDFKKFIVVKKDVGEFDGPSIITTQIRIENILEEIEKVSSMDD